MTTSSAESGTLDASRPDTLPSSGDAASAPRDGYRIEVQSKGEPAAFLCPPSETLLVAGLRQGLTLPYECATGTCGSCRARIGKGEVLVDWADAPGHAKIRQDRGDILMCQARPVEPCVLRIPSMVRTGGRHETPQHRAGVVGSVRALTGDVIHFEVALDSPITFDAGQFVVLRVPGLEGSRAYSMVNYGRATDRIELVVKRKPSGGFSRWLFDATRDGYPVDVFGPLGRATFHPEEDANLVMVAGGSGIAGMMSILSRAAQAGHFQTHRGHVFFGVRTLNDGFYLDEFARHVAEANGSLEVTLATSDEPAASPFHPRHPEIRVESGMVHEVCARSLEPGLNPIAYVAGPPPMVDGALRVLIAGGHATPDRIRYDKFG